MKPHHANIRPFAAGTLSRVVLSAIVLGHAAVAAAQTPERVNVTSAGVAVAWGFNIPTVSADGRFVAYSSVRHELTGTLTGVEHVIVRDRLLGTTRRVTPLDAELPSSSVMISPDGRYVAFTSWASNLVAGDTNHASDTFVYDQLTEAIVRVSVQSNGAQLMTNTLPIAISGTGRFVIVGFSLGIHDRDADADGIFDEPGGISRTGINLTGFPALGPFFIDGISISPDGRFLAFGLEAIYDGIRSTRIVVQDRDPNADGVLNGPEANVTTEAGGEGRRPQMTPDGRFVAFVSRKAAVADDTNGVDDVFVYDRLNGATRRVSVGLGGEQFMVRSGTPSISADGRFVSFEVDGLLTQPGHVYVHDRDADADGVLDEAESSETRLISEGLAGAEANDWSLFPAVSANGTHVVFVSAASNLIPDDTNQLLDIFIRALNRPPTVGSILVPAALVPVNTPVNVDSAFTDLDQGDTHAAVWNWGDGTSSPGTLIGRGPVSGTHAYTAPGVYTITLTVSDNSNASGTSRYQYVVVYDPSAGFVTGNGHIASPAGAYVQDPTLTGPARVSFVSKYQKGANAPEGNTSFDFHVADLRFHSDSYAWLVVAGARAQIKGTGRVNGSPGYGFLLTAVDGDLPGGGSDKVRIKIWHTATGTLVYDNQLGAAEDAMATTELQSGSIVIHK